MTSEGSDEDESRISGQDRNRSVKGGSVRYVPGDGGLVFVASPRHGEEGCMFLVFVLRQICKMLAIDCPAGSCETVPWSLVLCHRGRRWHHFAEERRWQLQL